MKRIVRLTESDLTRLVKRVIGEQSEKAKQIGECQKYFRSKGIDFGSDGGNYSSWYPNVPGYYIEGNLAHSDYEPSVFFYKEDKLNKLIPMDPKLVTSIKSLASTMGGKFHVEGKDDYWVEFQPGKCKQYADFCVKLMSLMKQNKK